MKDKYKITEEEINQTIIRSPYSLADSPASQGLKAKQVKKYFYEFIRFFANKINVHLEDLGKTLESYDEISEAFMTIPSLQEKDIELGAKILNLLEEHNSSEKSHPYINEKINSDIEKHNESAVSHADIRGLVKSILDKLDVAYCLASGKSRVYSCEDVIEALEAIDENEICKGDLLLVADPALPDFTVFETNLKGVPNGAYELDFNSVAAGEITFEPGKSYYYNGVRIIASIGTLETNLLAKKDELDRLEEQFSEHIEKSSEKDDAIEGALALKENAFIKKESISSEITIENHTEYSLGLITELSIALPEETEELDSIINFRTGATAPSFDAPSELVFSGDDTSGGRFYPITHRIYEINVKEVLGILTARVGATDYEVIE